jgi:hypothetical protein
MRVIVARTEAAYLGEDPPRFVAAPHIASGIENVPFASVPVVANAVLILDHESARKKILGQLYCWVMARTLLSSKVAVRMTIALAFTEIDLPRLPHAVCKSAINLGLDVPSQPWLTCPMARHLQSGRNKSSPNLVAARMQPETFHEAAKLQSCSIERAFLTARASYDNGAAFLLNGRIKVRIGSRIWLVQRSGRLTVGMPIEPIVGSLILSRLRVCLASEDY